MGFLTQLGKQMIKGHFIGMSMKGQYTKVRSSRAFLLCGPSNEKNVKKFAIMHAHMQQNFLNLFSLKDPQRRKALHEMIQPVLFTGFGSLIKKMKGSMRKKQTKNTIVRKITQPFAQKVSTTEGVHH